MTTQLLAFVLACTVVIVVPGPDFVLMLRNTAKAGRTGAAWTAAGILLGLAVLGSAAALGLTALLSASTTASTFIRAVGGGYLIYLGLQSIRSWLRLRAEHTTQIVDVEPRRQIAPGSPQHSGACACCGTSCSWLSSANSAPCSKHPR